MSQSPPILLVAAASVALAAVAGLGVGALWPNQASTAGAPDAPSSTPTPSQSRVARAPASAITLVGDTAHAAAGARINLSGHATGSGVALRVQERSNGDWVDFPANGTTRSDGTFASYVLFGRPGVHVLRMTEPGTGTVSNPITITVS